jgi:signal transduction histidine kinase
VTINFKARVLLELGAELISSDAVALYELVKNGVDAGSKKIRIDITVVLQPSEHRHLTSRWLATPSEVTWNSSAFLTELAQSLDPEASKQQRDEFLTLVGRPSTAAEATQKLADAAFKCNHVSVQDWGSGMTRAGLQTSYLTIGTPSRLHERRAQAKRKRVSGEHVPLGEKGIGRLAAMRVGHHVQVETGVRKERTWNELTLDWRPVFADIDLDASKLSFVPGVSKRAKGVNVAGTTIVIRDLQSDWTRKKVEDLGSSEFAKLRDPFRDNYANQFVEVLWQGKDQADVVMFQASLLDHADALCTINYRVGNKKVTDPDRGPRLTVKTNYKHHSKAQTLTHEGVHLATAVSHEPYGKRRPRAADPLPGSDEVIGALGTLGDFDAEFHWFNRGRLMREQNDLWTSRLQQFVRAWSGGLLVYRDGFRVYPYGSASDDWLDLDRKALASGGYKLNRAQMVGYLRITSAGNSKLQDQTNREGFRDCPEKEALRRLLRQAIISDCKTFLESVDKENQPADQETIRQLQRRIDKNQRAASNTLKQLKVRVPDESSTIDKVIVQLREVEDAWARAKQALAAHESEIERYIHLAGIGLMVELIAHELARATQSALELMASKTLSKSPQQLAALEAQIKTLNKRVRILDELSIPGRQMRAPHDIGELVSLVVDLYMQKAEREGVDIKLNVTGRGKLKQRVEKGQIIQILDNLLSNSMYWLARRLNRGTKAAITVEVDPAGRQVRVTDNGPGIPTTTGNAVFTAFYTTKPSGDGRGLGLYIAQRLAEENGATLALQAPERQNHRGFELTFPGA